MKEVIFSLIRFVFATLFCLALTLFFLEFYKTGFVTNSLDYTFLLILSLVFGIVTLSLPASQNKKGKIQKYLLSFFLAGLSALIAQSTLPDTFRVYLIIPWVAGVGVFVGTIALWDSEAS